MEDRRRFETIRGVVVSGKGEGELYVNLYAREFERILGFRPYPGTLNVRLLDSGEVKRRERILAEVKPLIIPPPRVFPGLSVVHCYPARLQGLEVFIVEPRIPGYDRNVAELIARDYLRGTLGLRDGDMVEILVALPGEA